MNKKEFAEIILNENIEAFVIHMFSLSLESIYLDRKA